ncbi:GNAT family N-acetyltransferase [Consotaella salsifontis]|uniref:Protein N-acetyltransferase, RimJ/RimL family n=1 Tax=Consotaella salsifontis TaxID=1365950 RepID=A0A1T4MAG2_9HYPH|nr:GNAT family N-acetyltransferase [Consotaella salsifontis]SJZ63993.1 Protein N-acetyltransferase, RimJ/RimL family [Consotaella salsifontis]
MRRPDRAPRLPPVAPPRIETARLILEAHELKDFDALLALWRDEAIVRHISGKPSTDQESWFRMLRYRGLWPLLGFGYWAVRERASGRFVGDIGFGDFHRPLTPSISGQPEAGWIISPAAQGQGYAREAMTAALAWLDEATPHSASVCIIAPDNPPSLRLARRLGYGEERTIDFQGEAAVLLTRRRPA